MPIQVGLERGRGVGRRLPQSLEHVRAARLGRSPPEQLLARLRELVHGQGVRAPQEHVDALAPVHELLDGVQVSQQRLVV